VPPEVSPTETCVICGQRPTGRYWVSLNGDLACDSHQFSGRCSACSMPRAIPSPQGWTQIDPAFLRCPTCAIGAVDTVALVRKEVPRIRSDLASFGIHLLKRVKVELADSSDLAFYRNPEVDGPLLGLTVTEPTEGNYRVSEVVHIRMLRGLPNVVFGSTLIHETGHAWLAQTGRTPQDPRVEEGFCELLAYRWLKTEPGAVSAQMRQGIMDRDDRLYGDGFRLVHTAVRQYGMKAVLAGLSSSGELPDR
jgi:hypothetical protein